MPKKHTKPKHFLVANATSDLQSQPDDFDANTPQSLEAIGDVLPQVFRLSRFISGGQTGVDRAALDVAIDNGVEHGGWVPKGRLAEDGQIPLSYCLEEMPTADYRDRTLRNVADSDGTLVLHSGNVQGGTFLTTRFADQLKKPLMVVKLPAGRAMPKVVRWVQENQISVLNVAGPRASKEPLIYDLAYQFLSTLVQRLHQR